MYVLPEIPWLQPSVTSDRAKEISVPVSLCAWAAPLLASSAPSSARVATIPRPRRR